MSSETEQLSNSTSHLCGICFSNDFKYKCPACGTKTCSLVCVKKHKLQFECSGHVDATKYVPMSNIKEDSNVLVQRDYNFLLTLGRKIDLFKTDTYQAAKPVFQKRRTKFNNNNKLKQRKLNDGINSNMINKGDVKVLQMPPGMQRAKNNKTFFDKKKNEYFWTIEWIFLDDNFQADKSVVDNKMPESVPVKKWLFQKHKSILLENRFIVSNDEPIPNVSVDQMMSVKLNETNQENTQKEATLTKEACPIKKDNIMKEDHIKDEGKNMGASNGITPKNTQQSAAQSEDKFNWEDCFIFIKKIEESGKEKHQKTLATIDPNSNLKTILSRKVVLEYPTIYIAKLKTIPGYHVTDEEEELDSDSSDSSDSDSDSSTKESLSDAEDEDNSATAKKEKEKVVADVEYEHKVTSSKDTDGQDHRFVPSIVTSLKQVTELSSESADKTVQIANVADQLQPQSQKQYNTHVERNVPSALSAPSEPSQIVYENSANNIISITYDSENDSEESSDDGVPEESSAKA